MDGYGWCTTVVDVTRVGADGETRQVRVATPETHAARWLTHCETDGSRSWAPTKVKCHNAACTIYTGVSYLHCGSEVDNKKSVSKTIKGTLLDRNKKWCNGIMVCISGQGGWGGKSVQTINIVDSINNLKVSLQAVLWHFLLYFIFIQHLCTIFKGN